MPAAGDAPASPMPGPVRRRITTAIATGCGNGCSMREPRACRITS